MYRGTYPVDRRTYMQQYILAYPGISRQYIEAVPDFRYYPPRRVTTAYEPHSSRVSSFIACIMGVGCGDIGTRYLPPANEKFAKVKFSQVSWGVSVQGGSSQSKGGLCPGGGFLSRRGVSVQEGGSLYRRGVSVQEGGVSV